MEKKVKKFIIEVEEGGNDCEICPFDGCRCSAGVIDAFDCNKYNLATMKIKEYDKESNTQTS